MTEKEKEPASFTEKVRLRQDLYTFILVVLLIGCATGLLGALIVYAPTMR